MAIEFNTHWFDEKNRKLWDENLVGALDVPIDLYLELGVGEGHSMRWVLENLKPKLAIGIDPYIAKSSKEVEAYKSHRAKMEENLAPWLKDGTLRIFYQPSYDVLVKESLLPKDLQFDLIYVDGNHQCYPCLLDCCLCWHLVKMNGIMIMDDYDRRWQRGWPQSYEGINAFLDGARQQYDLVWGDRCGLWTTHVAIKKVRDDWINSFTP